MQKNSTGFIVEPVPGGEFTDAERDSFYRIVASRRDIRRFRPDPVPEEILGRILWAAHHAGSVGYMQPWDFILIRDQNTRARVKAIFQEITEAASGCYEGERRALYNSLKLEGILEAPLNLCVTCDTTRGGPHVLGRYSIRETDVYSTCCAIQNLWLAARAEGLGVGWVSLVDIDRLRDLLGIPPTVIPVAYMCIGYPNEFLPVPELETAGWRRLRLEDHLHEERWRHRPGPDARGQ